MLTLACVSLAVGCGGDGGQAILKRRQVLAQLGTAYLDFYAAHQAAPASADELAAFLASDDSGKAADAIKGLEEGDVVMVYRGVLDDTSQDAPYVIGFEAGVPATGGYAVMSDGSVTLMTQKDFVEATMVPVTP